MKNISKIGKLTRLLEEERQHKVTMVGMRQELALKEMQARGHKHDSPQTSAPSMVRTNSFKSTIQHQLVRWNKSILTIAMKQN